MRSVSVIIVINVAFVCGWNHLFRTKHFDRAILRDPDFDNRLSPIHNVTKHTIWQPYDHFDPSEKRRFKTFYYQCLDFFQPNGPIYISLLRLVEGIEGYPIERNISLMSALTKETKGAMFVSEVRYFGSSQPPRNGPPDDEYYKYLNISQTLADLAEFIKYLKFKPEFQSSKVVLMGWGRAGNLATWMRVVYPNLVDAAIAATAPLLSKKDAKEYLEYTAYVYETYGRKNCVNDMEEKFQLFQDALKNASYLEVYKKKHFICESNNFTVKEDQLLYMISSYRDYYDRAVIGDIRYIKKCKFPFLYGICHNYHYADDVEDFKSSDSPDHYQSCLEFGQFITTSAKKRPFENYGPLDYHLKFCKDAFGIDEKRMDEAIAQTNLRYGGITPNVTNVVFTNGEFCPDRLLEVQQNLSDTAPAFLVKESNIINIIYT